MPTILLPQIIEQAAGDPSEEGPRLKKFDRDECDAIYETGLIDCKPLELIEGDILVKHTDDEEGPVRRRWTRDEVEALGNAGALDVTRLELIDGELYDKMGKNFAHVSGSHRLMRALCEVFGLDRVMVEGAIDIRGIDRTTNEPQPDIVVLRRAVEGFRTLPEAADVTLLTEISDTTIRFDLTTKARLYASAGIVEYWVVNLKGRKLIVHRDPAGDAYQSVVSYEANESGAPLAAPDHLVSVESLFGPTVAE